VLPFKKGLALKISGSEGVKDFLSFEEMKMGDAEANLKKATMLLDKK